MNLELQHKANEQLVIDSVAEGIAQALMDNPQIDWEGLAVAAVEARDRAVRNLKNRAARQRRNAKEAAYRKSKRDGIVSAV